MCRVDAQLVGSPGSRVEFNTGAVDLTGDNPPVGLRGTPMRVVDDLIGAIVDVRAERLVDRAALTRHVAREQRDIGLFDLASLELYRDGTLGLRIERNNEQARRIHVEAVDGQGTGGIREHLADTGGDTVGLIRPFSRNREQTAGLVDDDIVVGPGDDGNSKRDGGGPGAGCRRIAGSGPWALALP